MKRIIQVVALLFVFAPTLASAAALPLRRIAFDIEQGRWGGAATAGIGWNVLRGPQFGFGLEASDSMVIYSDESRHNFAVNGVLHLELF